MHVGMYVLNLQHTGTVATKVFKLSRPVNVNEDVNVLQHPN